MSGIGIFFGIVLIVAMVFCAFKESSITSPYKTFKIYGRLRAFFAFDFTGLGAVLIFGSVLDMMGYNWIVTEGLLEVVSAPILLLCGLGALILGILIYVITYKNCPEDWRGKLIIHMIMTALGTITKVGFFWLMFFFKIWSYTLPKYVTGSDGKSYLRYNNGDIYSSTGKRVGNETGDGKFTVLKADNGELVENDIEFK
jgi:hypothetical protein